MHKQTKQIKGWGVFLCVCTLTIKPFDIRTRNSTWMSAWTISSSGSMLKVIGQGHLVRNCDFHAILPSFVRIWMARYKALAHRVMSGCEVRECSGGFFTSRVSGRGNRIGAVFLSLCVCVCVSALSQPIISYLEQEERKKDFWAKGLYNGGNAWGKWMLRHFHYY